MGIYMACYHVVYSCEITMMMETTVNCSFTVWSSEVPRGRAEIGDEEGHGPSIVCMTSAGACLASG